MRSPTLAFARSGVSAIVLAVAAAPIVPAAAQPPVFTKASLFFELNATDGDIGLQGLFDAPAWSEGRIDGPGGTFNVLKTVVNDDSPEFGLNEILFESNEPTLEDRSFMELLTLFPQGNYQFTAILTDGQTIVGNDALTDDMPCPAIIRPPRQSGDDITLRWSLRPGVYNPDTGVCSPANPVQVTQIDVSLSIENDATGVSRTFQINAPLGVRSVEVPDEFLVGVDSDAVTAKVSVAVTEASGNRTSVETEFELQ